MSTVGFVVLIVALAAVGTSMLGRYLAPVITGDHMRSDRVFSPIERWIYRNPDLIDAMLDRASEYRRTNGLDPDTIVPVDAVAASASGLDPHISIANARLQAPRVAAARSIDLETVLALIDEHVTGGGVLGERAVSVLSLNLTLEDM